MDSLRLSESLWDSGALSRQSKYLYLMRPVLKLFPKVLALSLGAFLSAQLLAQVEPAISYQGRPIRFAVGERPYYYGSSAMMPLLTVCLAIGAGVKRGRDGREWSIWRGSDRLEFAAGTPWFTFNGARQTLRVAPEGRGTIVFVPLELIQTMAGGGLEVKATYAEGRDPAIFFGDRLQRFRPGEAPFRQDGVVYVPVKSTASIIGARVDTSSEGVRLTISRSRDKVIYDLRSRWFLFNGAQRPLRGESSVRGKTLYVPLELLQALVGLQLQAR